MASVLGEGGTAVVYAAQHKILGRQVAVKMSHVTGSDSQSTRMRLQREAQLCASVRDRHVPRIYALDQLSDGSLYVVMEKVDGVPLASYLATILPSVRLACQIAIDLLRGLAAVHRAGIVHRDVKPSNVIVNLADAAPRITLIDFGIGKVLRPQQPQLNLTRRGEILGTPLYMAPEQILEGPVDQRADIYAAGTVLYEMLAGRAPFAAPSVAEIFAGVLRDEVPDLNASMPVIPSALGDVVRTALSKSPSERFQTTEQMLAALEPLTHDLPGEPRSRTLQGLPRSGSGRVEGTPTVAWSKERRRRRGLRLASLRPRSSQMDVFLPTTRGSMPRTGFLSSRRG